MRVDLGRGHRSGFWPAWLLASLALHAALLLAFGPAPHRFGDGQAPLRASQSMTVRTLVLRSASTLSASKSPGPAAAPLPLHEAETSTLLQAPQLPPVTSKVAEQAKTSGGKGDEAGYLPRRELDEPPKLLLHVNLLWPDNAPAAGSYKSVISVFIDEAGVVQRVRMDGPELPESLQAVVRDAFLQAHFSPGRVKGFEVKSWLRMEVEFDTDAGAASRSES